MSTTGVFQYGDNGYKIEDFHIAAVDNSFLDLSDAEGQTFYFLEGNYSQVVLQAIYEALNAGSVNNQLDPSNSGSAAQLLEQAKNALETAEAAAKDKEFGLYTALTTAEADLAAAQKALDDWAYATDFDNQITTLANLIDGEDGVILTQAAALTSIESFYTELEGFFSDQEKEFPQPVKTAYEAIKARLKDSNETPIPADTFVNLTNEINKFLSAVDKLSLNVDLISKKNELKSSCQSLIDATASFTSFLNTSTFKDMIDMGDFYSSSGQLDQGISFASLRTNFTTVVNSEKEGYEVLTSAKADAQEAYNDALSNYEDSDEYTAWQTAVRDVAEKQSALDSWIAQATSWMANDLLNLCMMGSKPVVNEDGEARVVQGIEKVTNADGTVTYHLRYGQREQKMIWVPGVFGTEPKWVWEWNENVPHTYVNVDEVFTKNDAYANASLAYLVLATMYEKVTIQQMILLEQLKEIEKINEQIVQNNKALKVLSNMYESYYSRAIEKSAAYWYKYKIPSSDLLKNGEFGGSLTTFNNYLKNTVKCSGFEYMTNDYWERRAAHYNVEGKDDSVPYHNIDVDEQGVLTEISNKQEAVRMYGDQLSTDAQLLTTKMNQYMQEANTCMSAASQLVKTLGDYSKTITSNVR